MPVTLNTAILEQDNPQVAPILARVTELLEKHNVGWAQSGPDIADDGSVWFQLDVMPILPFFIDLAAAYEVQIEDVHVDAESVSTGYCETCAGHGLEVTVHVKNVFSFPKHRAGDQ